MGGVELRTAWGYDVGVEKIKADPKHLALWAIGGALLAASGFFTTLLPLTRRVLLCAFLAQVCVGFAVWFGVEARLKRRYWAGVWSDEELAPVRAMLARPAWIWGTGALFVAALITLAFTKHHGAMIYIAVIPMNAISSMRGALTPPAPKSGGRGVDWGSFKPLHSDHWGEARGDELLSS